MQTHITIKVMRAVIMIQSTRITANAMRATRSSNGRFRNLESSRFVAIIHVVMLIIIIIIICSYAQANGKQHTQQLNYSNKMEVPC